MSGCISRLGGTGLILSAAAVLMSCRSASAARPAPADLVLRGGRIVTLDDTLPEAEALAARGGRLVYTIIDGKIVYRGN
jgi:hypothetical protein